METDKLVRYFGSTSEQILTWSWRAGILFLWCWSLNLCANKLSIHAQNFKGLLQFHFRAIWGPGTVPVLSIPGRTFPVGRPIGFFRGRFCCFTHVPFFQFGLRPRYNNSGWKMWFRWLDCQNLVCVFFWVWAWGMVGSHRKMFKMTLFVCIATTTKPGNKISECSARQDIDVKKTANLLRKAIGILKSGLLRRGGCS